MSERNSMRAPTEATPPSSNGFRVSTSSSSTTRSSRRRKKRSDATCSKCSSLGSDFGAPRCSNLCPGRRNECPGRADYAKCSWLKHQLARTHLLRMNNTNVAGLTNKNLAGPHGVEAALADVGARCFLQQPAANSNARKESAAKQTLEDPSFNWTSYCFPCEIAY
jgi:hypothetical protein